MFTRESIILANGKSLVRILISKFEGAFEHFLVFSFLFPFLFSFILFFFFSRINFFIRRNNHHSFLLILFQRSINRSVKFKEQAEPDEKCLIAYNTSILQG